MSVDDKLLLWLARWPNERVVVAEEHEHEPGPDAMVFIGGRGWMQCYLRARPPGDGLTTEGLTQLLGPSAIARIEQSARAGLPALVLVRTQPVLVKRPGGREALIEEVEVWAAYWEKARDSLYLERLGLVDRQSFRLRPVASLVRAKFALEAPTAYLVRRVDPAPVRFDEGL